MTRMRHMFLPVCLGLLMLSACLPESRKTADPNADIDAGTTCAAAEFATLVGQPEAAASAIPDPKRILPPQSAMTMDHRIERTNVDLDENGVITRLWCG